MFVSLMKISSKTKSVDVQCVQDDNEERGKS